MKAPTRGSTGLVFLSLMVACGGKGPLEPSPAGGAGTNGGSGVSGAAGSHETAGTTGFAGYYGSAGTTGAAGDFGSAGTGFAGYYGSAGTTGAAGDLGSAGQTGTAGGMGCATVGLRPYGAWTNRTPATLPAAWPVARRGPAMAYDLSTKNVVMYGGYGSERAAIDTWEWSGATGVWVERKVTPPATSHLFAATYDSTRQRLFLFAGERFPDLGPTNDVWEWAGAEQSWSSIRPANPQARPARQTSPVAAYDPLRRRVVVYGAPVNGILTMHAWDPATRTWSDAPTRSGPGAVDGSTFIWDSCRDRGLLFDGQTAGVIWEWDPGTGVWTRQQGAGANVPLPRAGAQLVFDANVGRALLFGGQARAPAGSAPGRVFFDELWQWDAVTSTWWDLSNGPGPSQRASSGVAFDTGRARLVVFGGVDPAGFDTAEVWEWERQ